MAADEECPSITMMDVLGGTLVPAAGDCWTTLKFAAGGAFGLGSLPFAYWTET